MGNNETKKKIFELTCLDHHLDVCCLKQSLQVVCNYGKRPFHIVSVFPRMIGEPVCGGSQWPVLRVPKKNSGGRTGGPGPLNWITKNECIFNKRTSKVCNSCSWRSWELKCLMAHLTVSMFFFRWRLRALPGRNVSPKSQKRLICWEEKWKIVSSQRWVQWLSLQTNQWLF